MQFFNRPALTIYEANRFPFVAFRRKSRPQRLRGRPIVKKYVRPSIGFKTEDNVLILHLLGPAELLKTPGEPCFQKNDESFETGIAALQSDLANAVRQRPRAPS